MKRIISILPYLILPFLSFWGAEIYLLLTMLGLLTYDDMTYKGLVVSSTLVISPLVIVFVSLVYGCLKEFTYPLC